MHLILFDKDQSDSFPCLTLFYPVFNDDANVCAMVTLSQKNLVSKKDHEFEVKNERILSSSDKPCEIQRRTSNSPNLGCFFYQLPIIRTSFDTRINTE